jgi:type IV secretory pathway TrbL component
MFRQLIEAIRAATESSQSGSSTSKKVGVRGVYSGGPMVWHAGKQAEKRRTGKMRRQLDRKIAQGMDDAGTPGKPSRKKKPQHPRKVYQFGATFYPPGSTRRQRGHSK